MILLVGFYVDASAERMRELLTCIEHNAANAHIDSVHVFVEEDIAPAALLARYPQLGSSKIRLVEHGKRVTYRDLFDYANRELPGRRVIVANADIFFDETLAQLEDYVLAGKLLCLSRWDVQEDGSWQLFEFEYSQDAWIFRAPIAPINAGFHLGLLGCDNRLAWEAARAGLRLSNPSRTIRACHLHRSGVRRYTEAQRLHGPSRGVAATELDLTPRRSTPIYALTSLSPARDSIDVQRRAIASWREAGLEVRSFNHPSELATLATNYDVTFIPVEDTAFEVFGRHFIPINTMLEWAAGRKATALVINADIELRMKPWELQRVRRAAAGGLCYFIRHNHDGDLARAEREPYGIDAFLLSGTDAALVPPSFLSMGQPFWDYWLPHLFAAAGRPLVRVDFPAAFHRKHAQRWSWEAWHRCGLEFARSTGLTDPAGTLEECVAMAARVRAEIDRASTALAPQPFAIREWVERTFADAAPKTFLELGAHLGTDTAWLSQIPGVTMHAFEPDPRNTQPPRPNVTLHRAAISSRDGRASFVLSKAGWGQEWTHSSSLRPPKHHLTRYPVTFGEAIDVETVALDSFAGRTGIGAVDFIWADIQGAEGDMVRGALELLQRTRYLYTEYSDDELYEGQSTLDELLALLPAYRVVELWSDDVLLENTAFGTAAPPQPTTIAAPEAPAEPLVSCIMPTFNRRAFVPEALRNFLGQDYPNLELIVVDDGTDPIADLLPSDSRIVYVRLNERTNIGAKRNLACERARGEFIVHWDDDDWYPPSRTRVQIDALRQRGGDVCGSSVVYYLDREQQRAYCYRYSGSPVKWVAGNTLAYRRDAWARNRFPEINVGEDSQFVWRFAAERVIDLREPSLCVGSVHAGNISPKETRGPFWSTEPVERIQQLMAPSSGQPLLSCIMPTYNRRPFIPLALARFREQSYANRELIVVDDGSDAVGDLVRDEPSVRYIRLDRRVSIGTKRNLACAEARGELIAHWDDDDWYSRNRLARQAAPILRGEADVTGLENRFVLQMPVGRFWTVNRQLHRSMFVCDVHGGTLVYRRSLWTAGVHYPEVNLAEDAAFVRDAVRRGKRLMRLDNDGAFVYVRHQRNAWQFDTGTFLDPSGWSETTAPHGFTPDCLQAYRSAAGG